VPDGRIEEGDDKDRAGEDVKMFGHGVGFDAVCGSP
jgi:hypothetical protein